MPDSECGDGSIPKAGLIADEAGALYGTTVSGGSACVAYPHSGCGTIFKLIPLANDGRSRAGQLPAMLSAMEIGKTALERAFHPAGSGGCVTVPHISIVVSHATLDNSPRSVTVVVCGRAVKL